jgi:hypothetical protein
MPTTTAAVPTADQAMELASFIHARNEKTFKRAGTDDDVSDSAHETIRRLSNCTKLGVVGTLGYLLSCLKEHNTKQAALLWDLLTTCGEQWQEHPGWKAEWGNHARATLLDNLAATGTDDQASATTWKD